MIKYIPVSLLFICCFVFGGIMFKSVTPPRCESLLQDDSIFVLTGDERRIPYAIKKLDDLQYGNLYIIGAGAKNITDREHVSIESQSKSTYQNSLAIKSVISPPRIDVVAATGSVDRL